MDRGKREMKTTQHRQKLTKGLKKDIVVSNNFNLNELNFISEDRVAE